MAGQVADGRPRMEYTHQQAARRGSPILLACICAARYDIPLAASLASAACGGVDPLGILTTRPPPRSMPQEPCALGPGSWAPMSLPLPGPHTLPENPSLADPSGLHASTYK